MIRLLVLGLMFTITTSLASDPTLSDYRSHVDQARFFIKKGWLTDAHMELMSAASDPNGRLDAEVWFLLALLELQRCDMAAARHAASTAQTHAVDEEQLRQIMAVQQEMKTGYGWLTLPKSYPKRALLLQSNSTIFDTAAKKFFDRVQKRLEDSKPLPKTVALPIGTYTVDGLSITITENNTTAATSQAPKVSPAIDLYALTSVGTGLWLSSISNHLGAYGIINGAFGAHNDLLAGELGLYWSPQAFTQGNGAKRVQWNAFGATIAGGLHASPGKYRIQWMLGARAGPAQPIELFCSTEDRSGNGCTVVEGEDAFVYPTVFVFTAFTSIRVERTVDTGALGIAFVPEYGAGQAKNSGTARFLSESTEIQYLVESQHRSWRSFGGSLRIYVRWDL